MAAATDGKLVRTQVEVKIQLHAPGFVLAVIVLVLQSGEIFGAVQNTLGKGVAGIGCGNQAASAAELEPVAGKVVVVGDGSRFYLLRQRQAIGQVVALVIIVHLVDAGQAIAAVLVAGEIGVGKTQVGFIGGFFRILGLEQQALPLSFPTQFEHIVGDIVAGITTAAVDILETVAATLCGFDQETEVPGTGAVIGQQVAFAVLARAQPQAARALLWNRGGDHVHHAAGGLGAVAQQWRTLEHFQGRHAQGRGEIIGCGIGIGRGGYHDPVLKQGNLGGTLRGGPANTDIGAQTVTILFLDVDARHRFQQLVDVIRRFDPNLFSVDQSSRTRQVPHLFPVAQNSDFFQALGTCTGAL